MTKAAENQDPLLVAKGTPPTDWKEAPAFKTVDVDGHSFVVEPGVTRITAGHPLAKARPDLFVQEGGTTGTTRKARSRSSAK